ncbi:MAG: phosphohydrolase [Candidatus Omnitrophota bacterium]|jgi:predicted Zn-ribbon and HTH transcriptional regulator
MILKCPGQDDRNLKVEMLKCPDCGCAVEIFSDEIKARCPRCKSLIFRVRLPSCADWCKSARECTGQGPK